MFTPAISRIFVVGLLLAGAAAAQDDLAKAKAVFMQRLQEVKQESAKTDVLARYRKGLDALRLGAKQNGELEVLQAVDAEIRRFDALRGLPTANAAAKPPELAKLVVATRETLDKAELEHARKVIQLSDQYLQFLDQRLRQAVREDKIELAQAFKKEVEAAQNAPARQAAQFLMAEQQSEADAKAAPPAVPAPAAATNAPPAGDNNNNDRLQPRVDPDGLYDAARIYEGLPAVSLTAPSPYRQLGVMDTGKAPLTGGVGVALDGYLANDQARYNLRVKLRPKVSGGSFQNLKAIVQYFARNPNGGAIQEAGLQFAQIGNVGAKQATCEMKPVALPYAYTYRYRGGSFMQDRDGAFSGVVVSVFSPEDKLLAQVCSAAPLKERGKTTFERPAAWQERVYTETPGFFRMSR